MSPSCVRHVLLAEFDIDDGSVLRHQYPEPTGVDEQLLAEQMLPDGVHARSEDWTVFFIRPQQDATKRPLYAINLVRTKLDATAKRGALVKALAVCSTEPYIQIFKPLLLLALDECFTNPPLQVLENLLDSIRSMDLSGLPVLSRFERQILRSSDRRNLFEERFPSALRGSAASPKRRSSASGNSRADSHANESFQSDFLSNESGEVSPDRPRDTHYYDTSVLYNKVQIPVRIPVGLEHEDIGDYSIINLIQTFTPANPYAFPPPFHPHLHLAGAQTPPILLLLYGIWSGKRIIFLASAAPARQLTQLVLAACALANGGGSNIIPGISDRAFPYSGLHNRANQEAVPGYIAGVANPRFEDFTSSWDIFCNVDTGKITVSKDLKLPAPLASPFNHASFDENAVSSVSNPPDDTDKVLLSASSGAPLAKYDFKESYDMLFIEEVIAAVSSRTSEQAIRSRFAEYAQRFLRMASRYEEEKYGAASLAWPTTPFSAAQNRLGSGLIPSPEASRDLQIHKPIIDAWMNTPSYQLCKQAAEKATAESQTKGFDLRHQILRLRLSRNLTPAEVELIFSTLASHTETDTQIMELLSHFPAHAGGLLPLAFGLFHPSASVQRRTLDLFLHIDANPTGHKLISHLNHFVTLAYHRLRAAAQQNGNQDGSA